MRGLPFMPLLGAIGVAASPLSDQGNYHELAERKVNAYPSCTAPVLRVLDIALTAVGPKATTFCSSLIKATTVQVTATSSVTVRETTTKTVGETVITITSGVATITTPATVTETSTVTPDAVTKTIATPILQNRGLQKPYTPAPLLLAAATLASKACSCFLGPSKTTTLSITTTISSTDTSTVPSTVFTTVPSSTATITETQTVTKTINLPAPTQTISVDGKSYVRVYGPANGCVYNHYRDYIDLHGDIGNSDNNYLPGRKACAQRCNDKVDCKWFFFYVDIEGINQGYPAWCLLDDVFYQPAFIQCNIPWSGYNVGYNEISQ